MNASGPSPAGIAIGILFISSKNELSTTSTVLPVSASQSATTSRVAVMPSALTRSAIHNVKATGSGPSSTLVSGVLSLGLLLHAASASRATTAAGTPLHNVLIDMLPPSRTVLVCGGAHEVFDQLTSPLARHQSGTGSARTNTCLLY